MNDFHNSCSVGIMAYNEEANIKIQFHSLLSQELSSCIIDEIAVVSSGSTDNTEKIVEHFSKIDSRIKLIIQDRRLGKASAINLFLKNAKNKICILVNSDTILDKNAIEFLIRPFHNLNVGMTGARPAPMNSSHTFVEYVCQFMWRLHHKISLKSPKMGELIAFRKGVINKIPEETAVDEVCIESIVKRNDYKLVYVPESKVYIKTPDTIRDFIIQRRRIATGHLWAGKNLKYIPSTRNKWLTLKLTLKELSWNPKIIFFTLEAVFLECLSRILGMYDYYIRRQNPYIWEVAKSTKK